MQVHATEFRHGRFLVLGSFLVVSGLIAIIAGCGLLFFGDPCGGGVNTLSIFCPCTDDAECDDGSRCTADSCLPSPDNRCQVIDLCPEQCVETFNGYECVECLADSDCADNDPCTADSCTDRICTFQPFECDDEAP